MKQRPLEDQDKQPEGHGVCLLILILLIIFAIVAIYFLNQKP